MRQSIEQAFLTNHIVIKHLSFRLKSMNLYYLPPSPPCRAVLMLGRILKIDFNLKSINIQEKEHLRKDFLEVRLRSKNSGTLPCHCIIKLLTFNEQCTSSRVLIRALVLLTKLFRLKSLINLFGFYS